MVSLIYFAFLLSMWTPNLYATGFSWQQSSGFTRMFLQDIRAGKESLVLKEYDTVIHRYGRNSQPAIGILKWNDGQVARTDVPASFWHDPETDEIYVAMAGGSGFTILDPSKGRSLTYRNQGIWNTTDSPEGVLLREDWTFGPFRNTDPGLLFDLGVYGALRHVGTHDIVVATNGVGILVIHTGDPTTYADDVLDSDLWWQGPLGLDARLDVGRADQVEGLYEDTDGRLYADLTHGWGMPIIQPDMKTVTVYTNSGPKVYSPSSVTSFPLPKVAVGGLTRPLFRGRNGNLYVGSMSGYDVTRPDNTYGTGLTILQSYDESALRYSASVNYRTTGLWNTTDHVGLKFANFSYGDEETTIDNLITRTQRLPGSAVYHGWEDSSGVVYLGTSNGLALLHPDGQIETVPGFAGRLVLSSFKTSANDLYLNTDQGIEVWYADGTQGRLRIWPGTYPRSRVILPLHNSEILPFWLDRSGNLNAAIQGEGIEVYAPNMQGTATSFPVGVSGLSHPTLRWDYGGGEGTVRLQSRVGAATSAYINTFDNVSGNREVLAFLDSAFTRQQAGGILTLQRTVEPFNSVAWFSLPQVFPVGSVVQVRVRLRTDFSKPTDPLLVSMVTYNQTGSNVLLDSVSVHKDDWILLTTKINDPAERIGLSWRFFGGAALDLDYLAAVSPEGWTDWQALSDPAGSPIPQVDSEHPLLQWRAFFERNTITAPLPSLSGVWIEEGQAVTAVEEVDQALPEQTALRPNFPNPFNTLTIIEYQLSTATSVQLIICNLVGQPVRHLVKSNQQAGFYQISWDGIDDFGKSVGSGVYLSHLITDDFQRSQRLLLLK